MGGVGIGNLPLEWVRVFEAAGRTGSFTAAASENNLTQAAVSQRIRGLEERLGTRLFTRQARGVTLTVDGEAWLPYVTSALRSLNRSAEDLFGKPVKKVVISASSSVSQLWLAPRLSDLTGRATYQISVSTVDLETSFSRLDAMIDIRYGIGEWANVRKARLFREALVPMAAPGLLESGVPWRNLPCIAITGPRPGWQEWSSRTGEDPPKIPALRFDSFASGYAAAIAGAGVLLGSLPLCTSALRQKSLVRLSQDCMTLESGYWMTSAEDKLPQGQWDDLVRCLCAED